MSPRPLIHYFIEIYARLRGALSRPSDIVSFYSKPAYTGNARAVYEYIVKERLHEKYGFKPVWLTGRPEEAASLRRRGVSACYIRSPRCLNMYLSSRVHIADAFFIRVDSLFKAGYTAFILAWHGIPLKVGSICCDYSRRLNNVVDAAVSTSRFASLLLAGFIGLCQGKFRVTGYPRNDRLLTTSPRHSRQLMARALGLGEGLEQYSRVVLYAPTYRYGFDSGGRRVTHGRPLDLFANLPERYLAELDRLLRRYNTLFVVKYHHYDEEYYGGEGLLERFRRQQTRNIRLLTTESLARLGLDVYDMLPAVDVLVTDYSSIFYDYLLLRRPIIFYAYDLEEYVSTQGLVASSNEIDAFLPGPLARKPFELLKDLDEILAGGVYSYDQLDRVAKLIHRYRDPNSSRRVWERLIRNHIA